MRGYRFYAIAGIAFLLLEIAVGYFTVSNMTRNTGVSLIQNDLPILKRKTMDFANILQLHSNEQGRTTIQNQIQSAVSGTDREAIFITAIDWSGILVAHPDITSVGTKMSADAVALGSGELAFTADELYEILDDSASLPVYLEPIPNSDIVLIGNLNLQLKKEQIREFRNSLVLVVSLAGLVLLLFLMGAVRWLSSIYEAKLADRAAKLEDGVFNLGKLNTSLERYQEHLASVDDPARVAVPVSHLNTSKEVEKQRILTYLRNELLPVNTLDIAYAYVDTTITYIVQKSGKKSTSNESLDQIYRHLDERLFFRANRQIIVAISAIRKITKYGNSQLKIEVEPESDIPIIIGKNKAAAFKQWLDQ